MCIVHASFKRKPTKNYNKELHIDTVEKYLKEYCQCICMCFIMLRGRVYLIHICIMYYILFIWRVAFDCVHNVYIQYTCVMCESNRNGGNAHICMKRIDGFYNNKNAFIHIDCGYKHTTTTTTTTTQKKKKKKEKNIVVVPFISLRSQQFASFILTMHIAWSTYIHIYFIQPIQHCKNRMHIVYKAAMVFYSAHILIYLRIHWNDHNIINILFSS